MKKLLNLSLLASALLFFNACSNNSSTDSNTSETKDTVKQAKEMNEDKKIDDDDSKFATEAASGGMMEVEMGKMAAKEGMSADVKAFGEKMVADHTKPNDELKALAATKNITLPAGLSDDDQKMINKLSTMKGKDFDKKYVSMMADDHDKDVDHFEKAAKDCKDPDLKAWADKTLPTLKSHKDMIHKIKDNMR
jgi:putative membrane protein